MLAQKVMAALPLAPLAFALGAAIACSSGAAELASNAAVTPAGDSGVAVDADASSHDVTTPPNVTSGDAAPAASDGSAVESSAPADPCPTLPIPTTCFGRNIVYREWNATATGDGTYFASQAPYRLGFNRTQGNIWIVKFRTDANTYRGRVSSYGDATAGLAWISDKPCDETFALSNKLVAYGNHGGGMIMFDVARDANDANRLRTDPAYAAHKTTPQLEGGHCYYAAFENTEAPAQQVDASLWSSIDTCGSVTGRTDCYYLAFDMSHYLQDPITGQRMAGSVIAGLTQ